MRLLIRLLVSFAICIIGFFISDILLPYGWYLAFAVMYFFGTAFCCMDIYFTRDEKMDEGGAVKTDMTVTCCGRFYSFSTYIHTL